MVPLIISGTMTLWVIVISVWIVLQRRSPTATLAWIFGLAVLPGVGLLVYVFFGPRRLHRKQIRRGVAREAIARWTDGKSLADLHLPLPEDPKQRSLVEVGIRAGEAPAVGTSEVRFLFDGDEFLEALLGAVAQAKHHIHLESYILRPGHMGQKLTEALARKAAEGVEVRLLLDSYGSSRADSRFLRPLRDSGAAVRYFNSTRLARLRPTLANFRTHRKIVVVDGKTALTGGMNIMDENLPSIHGEGAWRDCHLLLRGAAAIPLQLTFLEDWHYAAGSAPEGPAYVPRPDPSTSGPLTQIVTSGPDAGMYAIHRTLFTAIGQARSRVLATTPYLVPDEPILAALSNAALRGVEVRLLVPAKTDSFLVGAAAKSYYTELLQTGVRIFEYQPSMIHSKTMVIDDDVAIVGTANLDNRSFRLNFEVIAVVFGEGHAGQLADRFAEDLERAEEVTSRRASDLPRIRRLVECTARLFSPIL